MGLFNKEEKTPAQTVIEDVCRVKKNERVLIIANPETTGMAQDLFTAAQNAGAHPVLMFQPKKTTLDATEKAVIGALKTEPDVTLSISALKLGRDMEAIAKPYADQDGKRYDNVFDFLLSGKKTMRAVWAPGLTEAMFNRTVKIDYKLLADRCKKICAKYERARSVHVTAPNGTDILVPVQGRTPMVDNGDFSTPGSGGNIPAGEVFISPVVGKSAAQTSALSAKTETATPASAPQEGIRDSAETPQTASVSVPNGAQGVIVYDGSMSFSDGDMLLKNPITVTVQNGFIVDITGGEEAKRLLKDITAAEKESLALESAGKLPKGHGAVYAKNARNIGELGIGLNPNANITGNMLEDEKAFRTCHFAIGENYDGDAPALIHFDGVVRNPTVEIVYENGKSFTLMNQGELNL
ncbi:MAG: peptidase M17 [Treponema sp.]|nr:peptidase M17 [Treponema sp.]